jgi:hypothetical protein
MCMDYLMTLPVSKPYSFRQQPEWQTGKDLDGSSQGLTKVLFWYLHGRAEENHENLNEDSWCPDQNSNQASPKYKSRTLSADQPIQ